MSEPPPANSGSGTGASGLIGSDDWWAIWLGAVILCVGFLSVQSDHTSADVTAVSALDGWIMKPGEWDKNPLNAFVQSEASPFAIPATGVFLFVLFSVAHGLMKRRPGAFMVGFPPVFCLACLAYVLAGQSVIKAYNLEFALWALLLGLLISNSIGTPGWIKPAIRTEFYIKTGLVVLGAEVLVDRLLAFGTAGVFVAWIVTPIVLISTYAFGQRILKMSSPSLNMVIAADMSVCGVSAAIATAAACKAKKEELSFAIGLSLTFTVIMMIVLPVLIGLIELDPLVGGAWLGGTIDSTGAVSAAGVALGPEAMQVATTVKMIQNILIGVVSFCVAIYWVTRVERDSGSARPGLGEIWNRFPKFILGFVAASLVFSGIHASSSFGTEAVETMVKQVTKGLRGWLFCIAFVCIGLETNFRALKPFLSSGKPLVLYIVGQSLNLLLTLTMAYLMFGVVFRDSILEVLQKAG